MVIVEPFTYQKVTAFKERMQIVSKINEIIDALETAMAYEDVVAYVETALSNYYTKAEVDQALASIDLSQYYTKTEIDGKVADINEDIETGDSALGDRCDSIEDDIASLESSKQDNITPIAPLVFNDTELKLNGFELYTNTDWTDIYDSENFCFKKDVYVVGRPNYNFDKIPKEGRFYPANMKVEFIKFTESSFSSNGVAIQHYSYNVYSTLTNDYIYATVNKLYVRYVNADTMLISVENNTSSVYKYIGTERTPSMALYVRG